MHDVDDEDKFNMVFANQMELAAGTHCVIELPRPSTVPSPQWHTVVTGMILPAKQCTSSRVFFDGWNMYGTREQALDCTFVEPLIRVPDAEYHGGVVLEDDITFLTELVDGQV